MAHTVPLGGPTEAYYPPESPRAPHEEYWPLFFARRDIHLRNLDVKRDQLMPRQRKSDLRDFLRSLQPNIDTVPLTASPLLKVLRVPRRLYDVIVEEKMNFSDAEALLKRRTQP
jgi:hypothetical protein